MLGTIKGLIHGFIRDESGAAPIEVGAGVLAALAAAIGFVAVLETMV